MRTVQRPGQTTVTRATPELARPSHTSVARHTQTPGRRAINRWIEAIVGDSIQSVSRSVGAAQRFHNTTHTGHRHRPRHALCNDARAFLHARTAITRGLPLCDHSAADRAAEYCDERVCLCLCVCLPASISSALRVRSSRNYLCMLTMAVVGPPLAA